MKLAYRLLITMDYQLSTCNKIIVTKINWNHKLVGNLIEGSRDTRCHNMGLERQEEIRKAMNNPQKGKNMQMEEILISH